MMPRMIAPIISPSTGRSYPKRPEGETRSWACKAAPKGGQMLDAVCSENLTNVHEARPLPSATPRPKPRGSDKRVEKRRDPAYAVRSMHTAGGLRSTRSWGGAYDYLRDYPVPAGVGDPARGRPERCARVRLRRRSA